MNLWNAPCIQRNISEVAWWIHWPVRSKRYVADCRRSCSFWLYSIKRQSIHLTLLETVIGLIPTTTAYNQKLVRELQICEKKSLLIIYLNCVLWCHNTATKTTHDGVVWHKIYTSPHYNHNYFVFIIREHKI